jgi:hypothetical protein
LVTPKLLSEIDQLQVGTLKLSYGLTPAALGDSCAWLVTEAFSDPAGGEGSRTQSRYALPKEKSSEQFPIDKRKARMRGSCCLTKLT